MLTIMNNPPKAEEDGLAPGVKGGDRKSGESLTLFPNAILWVNALGSLKPQSESTLCLGMSVG